MINNFIKYLIGNGRKHPISNQAIELINFEGIRNRTRHYVQLTMNGDPHYNINNFVLLREMTETWNGVCHVLFQIIRFRNSKIISNVRDEWRKVLL